MRVLQVAGICHHGPSGGARSVADLCTGLKTHASVDSVFVSTASQNDLIRQQLAQADIKVIERFVPSLLESPLSNLRAVGALARDPRVRNVDIVHGHAHFLGPKRLAGLLRKPLVITLRGVPGFQVRNSLRRRLTAWATRSALRRAKGVVAISAFLRDHLFPPRFKADFPIHVIHNACDTDLFRPGDPTVLEPLLQELRADGGIVAGIVGRLDPGKQPQAVLELAAMMADTMPTLRFVYVGSGSEENQLRAAIRRRGLEDRVMLLGYRESIADI